MFGTYLTGQPLRQYKQSVSPWPLDSKLKASVDRIVYAINKYNEALDKLAKDKSKTQEAIQSAMPFVTYMIAIFSAFVFGMGLVRRIYEYRLESSAVG